MADVAPARREPPHFFCIGPGKSATTWIADHLKLHLDVWLPPIQEISYLNAGFSHYRGSEHLELRWDWWNLVKRVVRNKSLFAWRDREFFEAARRLAEKEDSELDLGLYRALFRPAHGRLTGDISPAYALLETHEIERAMPVLEGRPIFATIRDPVDRFWSAMAMYYRYRLLGEVDYGSVETAQRLFHDPVRSKAHFPTEIVARWEAALGVGRVATFFFDDVVARPRETLRAIVEYIGGDYRQRIPVVSPSYNRQGGGLRPTVSPAAREWVRKAFQPELEACARRFGGYGEAWLARHGAPAREG